jgi:hypothetical protein
VLSEIVLSHELVGVNLFAVALSEKFAIFDYVGAMANREGFADIVVGDEHPDAKINELFNDPLNVNHGERIDPCERLI